MPLQPQFFVNTSKIFHCLKNTFLAAWKRSQAFQRGASFSCGAVVPMIATEQWVTRINRLQSLAYPKEEEGKDKESEERNDCDSDSERKSWEGTLKMTGPVKFKGHTAFRRLFSF